MRKPITAAPTNSIAIDKKMHRAFVTPAIKKKTLCVKSVSRLHFSKYYMKGKLPLKIPMALPTHLLGQQNSTSHLEDYSNRILYLLYK